MPRRSLPRNRNEPPGLPGIPALRDTGIRLDADGLPGAVETLHLYAVGLFPMAESDGPVAWYDTKKRAVLPLDGLQVSRSLARSVRLNRFRIRVNGDFEATVAGCANRESTWINRPILRLFCELNELGFAHSVEAWMGGRLAGGLYGLAIGSAFVGESMFSDETDASKVALVHLAARLNHGGFMLHDCQLPSPHLDSLGARLLERAAFQFLLAHAVRQPADFHSMPEDLSPQRVLQLSTQMS